MNDKSLSLNPENMEPSIFKYILRHTSREQLALVLLTLVAMPFVYFSLEVPKVIINDAISGGARQYSVFSQTVSQTGYLLLLSALFLLLVVINGLLKYIINVYRGVLGERMLRRFRYTLYSRLLRFPLPFIKRSPSAEYISMITAESESLGGFIGDSIALPVFQGGLLITYIYFIFAQNVWLGLASIALYPPQAYLIPRLQKKVNELSRQRVQAVRNIADRVEESVGAVTDIKVNDASRYERADFSSRLATIFDIRLNIYKRKFFIKFLNSFLGNLTPFFFYSVGGYLVINGSLSLGALVAVLAAYKDIAPPWKELLKYYQIMEDVKVKYAQIIRHFEPENMVSEEIHAHVPEHGTRFKVSLEGINVSMNEAHHASRLDRLFFKIRLDKHTGVYSDDYESTREFLFMLTGMDPPKSGVLEVDGKDLCAMPEYIRGRNIGYCNSESFILNLTVSENLYFGLKNRPAEVSENSTLPEKLLKEARSSGNSLDSIDAVWRDIESTGFSEIDEFDAYVQQVLDAVELDGEIMALALESKLNRESHEALMSEVVSRREQVNRAINEVTVGGVIEAFDRTKFNSNLTVAENLLFGTPVSTNSDVNLVAEMPEISEILVELNLKQTFFSMGRDIANLMFELFGNVEEQRELVERYSFIEASRFDQYRAIIDKSAQSGFSGCTESEQGMLIDLAMQLCPAKHNLDLISTSVQQQIVEARFLLANKLGLENEKIQFIEEDSYQTGMTIRDNLLFGKIAYNKRHLVAKINEKLNVVIEELGLTRYLIEKGLEFDCGNAGSNLSQGFRQKLAVARSLVKNPDILIVDDALSTKDAQSQRRILQNIIALRSAKNLIWTIVDKDTASWFDSVLLIEDQTISEVDATRSL